MYGRETDQIAPSFFCFDRQNYHFNLPWKAVDPDSIKENRLKFGKNDIAHPLRKELAYPIVSGPLTFLQHFKEQWSGFIIGDDVRHDLSSFGDDIVVPYSRVDDIFC